MRLVVGLGNPGEQYLLTRHNAGFLFLDYLIDHYGLPDYKAKFLGGFTEGTISLPTEADKSQITKLMFLKPMTFMNLSGNSVRAVAQFYKIAPKDILVIHDEVDLPLGTIRSKQGGGNAGHNGLKSIEQSLNSPNFWRLRIGVGRSAHEQISTADHVLGNFTKAEFNGLTTMFPAIREAFEKLLSPRHPEETLKKPM